MKNKKLIIIIAVIAAAILAVSVSSAAVKKYTSAKNARVQKIVNRVNIEVDKTQFTYDDLNDGDIINASAKISIEKSEPDFYGKLVSITIEGADFTEKIYVSKNKDDSLPQNINLPCGDPLSWNISFSVPYSENIENSIYISFDYITGINEQTKQEYITKIPISIINEKSD